jgi:hypothetical protein
MNVTVIRQAVFYEHFSNERGGFCFMNIAVLRESFFYEYYSHQTSGIAL